LAEIPTIEPVSFYAGDSVRWKRSLGEFPASQGWTLNYVLVKEGTPPISITAQADGDDHLVLIAPTVSTQYAPGSYRWQASVSKGTDRFTIDKGTVEINADFATQTTGFDARSHVQRMVDALRARLEKRATKDQMEMMVGGEKLALIPMHRVRELLSFYETQLEIERKAERIAKGLGGGGNILTRFVR